MGILSPDVCCRGINYVNISDSPSSIKELPERIDNDLINSNVSVFHGLDTRFDGVAVVEANRKTIDVTSRELTRLAAKIAASIPKMESHKHVATVNDTHHQVWHHMTYIHVTI